MAFNQVTCCNDLLPDHFLGCSYHRFPCPNISDICKRHRNLSLEEFLRWLPIAALALSLYTCYHYLLQPIPLGVSFSKAQSSKLEHLFCHVTVKREVRALSFDSKKHSKMSPQVGSAYILGSIVNHQSTANPTGGDISNAVSKLKTRSSKVSFPWNVAKETFELWVLSFRKYHPKWYYHDIYFHHLTYSKIHPNKLLLWQKSCK